MENFTKTENYFTSSDGKHKIYYYLTLPINKPKAILQFCHGLAEHGERYLPFAEFLASKDIAFCIHDSLGHKKSVFSDDELGYYGENDGWKFLYKDALILTDILKTKFPNIPFFIGGHSMGSFVTRAYLPNAKQKIDGALIIGTGNATTVIKVGTTAAKLIGLFKGKTYHSKLLDTLSFGAYNKKISSPKTAFDWLSENEKNVSDYNADKYCGFISATRGFVDVSLLIRYISKTKVVVNVDKNIPLLFISGSGDPVGEYGKLVNKAADLHKKCGASDVTVTIMDGMRHEVLNENGKEKTYDVVLKWLTEKGKLSKVQ